MNTKTKATSKIGLVKINLVNIRVIGCFFITRDPNLYGIKKRKPIPDPFFFLSYEGTRNCPGFIGGERRSNFEITRSSNEDNPFSRSLDLTSDIFNDLATLAEWETRGNNEERKNLYG